MPFQPIVNRMLQAGWLVETPRISEWVGGYYWSPAGEDRRLLLKDVFETFRTDDGVQATLDFPEPILTDSKDATDNRTECAQQFLHACCAELHIARNAKNIKYLVAILMDENDFLPATSPVVG